MAAQYDKAVMAQRVIQSAPCGIFGLR